MPTAPDPRSPSAAKERAGLAVLFSGLMCGLFFWGAATEKDWTLGVGAGVMLAAFILDLGALARGR